jgi:hypothetical protein
MDPRCENGYYFLAASLSCMTKYQAAFEEILQLMANIDDPSDFSYKLKSFLCTKIRPPNYRDAVETFDIYLKAHPEDLNAVSYHSLFVGLQLLKVLAYSTYKELAY